MAMKQTVIDKGVNAFLSSGILNGFDPGRNGVGMRPANKVVDAGFLRAEAVSLKAGSLSNNRKNTAESFSRQPYGRSAGPAWLPADMSRPKKLI